MPKTKDEYEIIDYSQIQNLKIFLVSLAYRTPHLHAVFEINFVLRGSVRIITGTQNREVNQGALYIFNSYEAHELYGKDNALILSFQISPAFCRDYFPLFKNIVFDCTHLNTVLSESEILTLDKSILGAALAYFSKNPGHEFRCLAEMNYIFAELIRAVPYHVIRENEYLMIKEKNARMRRIIGYIEEHYTEKISEIEIAKNEGISPTYLSHFFRGSLHISFQDYVNNLRFDKAVQLFEQAELRLIDISMESGFSDIKYLNKMFLKNYGCLPKEYRKESKKVPGSANKSVSRLIAQYIYSQKESLEIIEKVLGESLPVQNAATN